MLKAVLIGIAAGLMASVILCAPQWRMWLVAHRNAGYPFAPGPVLKPGEYNFVIPVKPGEVGQVVCADHHTHWCDPK